jgi:hypothetical protein
MNPSIFWPLMKLAHRGYWFRVSGGTIQAKYHGPGKPDLAEVKPLFEVIKAHKPEVVSYLTLLSEIIQNHPGRPSPPATCESCPWYALNPWTHYPDFGAWCHFRMEHLVVGSPACEEFKRGEVPLKATPNTAPQAPALGESVLNTMDRTRARAMALRTAARLF